MKGPGIGWNALTMVVVEGIIYIFWIGSQGLLYLYQSSQHSSGTINTALPHNNPNENDDDAANDSEDEDQKSQSDGRTQNVNPELQGDGTDDSSEKP